MKTKLIALVAALLLAFCGVAFAEEFEGEVTKVKGKKIIIEITKGDAKDIEVGSKVELEVEAPKGGDAPEEGEDMLQGC